MNRAIRPTLAACCLAGAFCASAGAVRAQTPFYGYSGYFGGPSVYFTPDDTIHQVTKPVSVEHSLGTRTYYRGGPFWTYEYGRPGFARSERVSRRRTVLRRKY